VEAAAQAQAALGDCLNGPTEHFVALAEALVERIAHADWVMFQKNGTDATTVALMVARAATGRRKVLVAQGSYHGAAPWCTPVSHGTTTEDRAHLIRFAYNDVASLAAAASEAGSDLAAILVSPIQHDLGIAQQAPMPAFAQRARALCDAAGAALVLDEVRTGLRLHDAGSWEPLGIRPDLSAWSKALANGHALAAVTGCDALREAATRIFTTGSFWAGGVAMAAARATLAVAARDGLVPQIERMGQRLRQGLAAQAATHGVPIHQSGPVQMPLILFDGDTQWERGFAFTAEALRHGVYLHPKHNMFLSLAHTEADIDQALQATDAGFAAVAARFGRR
jgi:glutamate-1-semialdehyde 2,1-aminomutase